MTADQPQVFTATIETPFGDFTGEGPTQGQAMLAAYVAALREEARLRQEDEDYYEMCKEAAEEGGPSY